MRLSEISARDIAVSGLKAQRARMTVIANNIANAQTTRTEKGGAFRRQLAFFRGGQLRPGVNPDKLGVRVEKIVPDRSPFKLVYDPSHPDANAEGYVEHPNISLSMEMVDLVSAHRAYDANVAVLASDRRMNQTALQIIER